jgi:teichuronic acid biosynthesis glycosyltransferase TuaC
MKVTVLTTSFPYPGSTCTAGIFFKTQVDALARLGIEVEVIAPVPWVPYGFDRMSARWSQYKGIPEQYRSGDVSVIRPRYLQFPKGNYWAPAHRSFARLVKSVSSWKPDIVHAHFAYPPGLAVLDVSRTWDVPCLLTLHGSDVNEFPFLNSLTRSRFKRAVKGVSHVLSVSVALADRTEQLTGRRPEVLPTGIDLGHFAARPEKELFRRELKIPEGKRVILFVGSLIPDKGVRELVQALMRMAEDNVVGIFVGDGPLRKEVLDCPLAWWAGPQPNSDLVRFYNSADVFVLPSYSEGLGTVLVEAGSVGIPIVATDVGGIPELLGQGRGLIIAPRNSAEIVSGIRAVLADNDQAYFRANKLKLYINQFYDCFKNAEELVKIYTSFL